MGVTSFCVENDILTEIHTLSVHESHHMVINGLIGFRFSLDQF